MLATVGIRTLMYRKCPFIVRFSDATCGRTPCATDEFASLEEVMLRLGLKRKSTGLYAEPHVAL